MQFGHKVEVHTVQTRYKRWRKEDHIHDGEYLDNLVLLDVYQAEEGILQVVQSVESESCVVEKGINILDNHIDFINDELTLKECLTFVKNEGRMEAQEGAHDDLVMSLAITYEAAKQLKPRKQAKKKPRSCDIDEQEDM